MKSCKPPVALLFKEANKMRIEEILELNGDYPHSPRDVAEYDINELIKMLARKEMIISAENSVKTANYHIQGQPVRETTMPLRTAFCAEDHVTVTGYMLQGFHRGTNNSLEIKMGNYSSNHHGVCSKGIKVELAVIGYVGQYQSEQTKCEIANLVGSFEMLKDILLKCNRR